MTSFLENIIAETNRAYVDMENNSISFQVK